MNTVTAQKISDCETKFTISGKEYSIGSAITSRLNEDPNVVMAGSKIVNNLDIIVVVKEGEDPKKALTGAVSSMINDIENMLHSITKI